MARYIAPRSSSLFSIPLFLAPAFSTAAPCSSIARSFSSTTAAFNQIPRGKRDKNRQRGVSAIRRTGPRKELAVTRLGLLPKPVADPSAARAAFEVDPNHGLWGFFNEGKEALIPPNEEDSHGRPWSKRELERKGWSDLYKLYWVCVKEINVVRTRNNERRRLRVGYGQAEGEIRIYNLRRTMHRTRQVLLERHYANFDAQLLLEEKNLYELYPDILESHVSAEAPELLGGYQEDTFLADNTTSSSGSASDTLSSVSEGLSTDTAGRRQKITE